MYPNFHTIRQYDHFKKFITSDIIIHRVKFVFLNINNDSIRQIENLFGDQIIMRRWLIELISNVKILNF